MMFTKRRLGRSWPKLGLALGALFASALAWPVAAAWAQTCTTTICTGSATACSISGTHTLTDDCILDFGTKDVTINSNGKLTVADNSHNYTVEAGSLVVRGELEGGSVSVLVDNGFTTEVVSNSPGRIDINGTSTAGQTFSLVAGGAVLIDGKSCDADATSVTETGAIDLTGASITIAEPCTAKGTAGFYGGAISLTATGSIDVNAGLQVDGGGTESDGGSITMDAGTTVTTTVPLLANGTGGGYGGSVDILGGGAISVGDDVNLGAGVGDADGGAFDVWSTGGSVTIAGAIDMNGTGEGWGGDAAIDAATSFSTSSVWETNAGTDGAAGSIEILAGTSATTTSSSRFRLTGGGDGGSVDIEAGATVTLDGTIDTQAGGWLLSAGDVEIEGEEDVTISGDISADSTSGPDSSGALVEITSWTGDVSISSVVDAGAAGADGDSGDIWVTADAGEIAISGTLTADAGTNGAGNGSVQLSGCEVEITGAVDTRTVGGPDDGSNTIWYNNGLVIPGSLLADNGGSNDGSCKCVDVGNDGCDLPLTCEVPPNTTGGTVTPALVVTPVSFPAC